MASIFWFFSLCLHFPQERDIVNKPMTVSLLGMVIRLGLGGIQAKQVPRVDSHLKYLN